MTKEQYQQRRDGLLVPIKGFVSTENEIMVKGKTEEKATVTVNERFVVVGSEGNFEYSLTLSEGENKILIVAIDKAGNKTEKELKVTYTP